MSGPDTSGSFGLNGIPLTNDAPKQTKQPVISVLTKTRTKQKLRSYLQLTKIERALLQNSNEVKIKILPLGTE